MCVYDDGTLTSDVLFSVTPPFGNQIKYIARLGGWIMYDEYGPQ